MQLLLLLLLLLVLLLLIIFLVERNVPKSLELFNSKVPKSNLPIIVYINLDKDRDRKRGMEQLFNKLKYPKEKIIRCRGIKKTPGLEGCRLSHMEANRIAIEKTLQLGGKYYLICEDDLNLVGNFYQTLDNILNYQKKIDMVLLECGDNLEQRINLRYTDNSKLMRILGGGNNSGCYLTNPSFGLKLIDIWEKHPMEHCDHSWQPLWLDHQVFLTKPLVFVQKGGKSNIENEIRNAIKPFDFKLWKSYQNS